MVVGDGGSSLPLLRTRMRQGVVAGVELVGEVVLSAVAAQATLVAQGRPMWHPRHQPHPPPLLPLLLMCQCQLQVGIGQMGRGRARCTHDLLAGDDTRLPTHTSNTHNSYRSQWKSMCPLPCCLWRRLVVVVVVAVACGVAPSPPPPCPHWQHCPWSH